MYSRNDESGTAFQVFQVLYGRMYLGYYQCGYGYSVAWKGVLAGPQISTFFRG